ncbi:hypothetical protein OIE66_34965 [Nonomuraea sp. NBC_01738]|uniref:WXG100 family type VII secretion target n=1 Tax=Nonomuraea sp. NBC_01738 TaxID=2976003 RepID=UPI002E142118|nr:hypothetical protein OIE66_34965 [Nonomuraea sp. NBC_01738]
MGERKEAKIRGETPAAGEVNEPKDKILALLKTSDLQGIALAGIAYQDAADFVHEAVEALKAHEGKIATAWKGPDAAKAREALDLMQKTGTDMVKYFKQMGTALGDYAVNVSQTTQAVETIKVEHSDPAVAAIKKDGRSEVGGSTGITSAEVEAAAIKVVEDRKAREEMKKLNEQIQTLFLTGVPDSVTYELPKPDTGGPSGGGQTVTYASSSGTKGPTFGTSADSQDGRSSGGGATVVGAGGDKGKDGAGGGKDDSTGGKDDSTGGKDGSDGGKDGTDGTGDKDGTDDGKDGGKDGGSGDDTVQGSQPGGKDGATDDGTTPPVIGADDKTSLDDASDSRDDPNDTENSSFQPTTTPTILPSTGNPVTTFTPTTVSPVSPGVPSVIGTPSGGISATASTGLPFGRGAANGMSGMPMMPMGGAGMPGGDGGEEHERLTYLPEDLTAGASDHDVTEPVIG